MAATERPRNARNEGFRADGKSGDEDDQEHQEPCPPGDLPEYFLPPRRMRRKEQRPEIDQEQDPDNTRQSLRYLAEKRHERPILIGGRRKALAALFLLREGRPCCCE